MILLLSNERDLTTDFVVRELRKRDRDFFRLNTDGLMKTRLAYDPGSSSFDIETADGTMLVKDVRAAYFRRPEIPKGIASIYDGSRQYAVSEWNALLKSLYVLVGDRWFSHPKAILLAEDKPSQLRLAGSLGFSVPPTMISNDFDLVRDFVNAGPTVAKPLRQATISEEDGEHVVFTSEVTSLNERDRASLQIAPVIFQRKIAKRLDLRVTVVGDKVFAAAIHSQDYERTAIDWRRSSDLQLRHEKFVLPDDIALLCVEFVRQQNIRFGAIDLVLDEADRFWFLECNPNGQWAWIENRLGLPIASAIVDELEAIAR